MALLERVTTLIRANLNELIEGAEQPETMIRQIILDMENQLIQLKTQVAISIADQHMREKKLKESHDSEQQWLKRAEMALDKEDDSLARAAAARAVGYRSIAESFAQQVEDQKAQVEDLKAALLILQLIRMWLAAPVVERSEG
jgi:phage shock protein A